MSDIKSIRQCISKDEKKTRTSVYLINGLIWIVLAVVSVASMGALLVPMAIAWLGKQIWSEFHARSLIANGLTADEEQFPEIKSALTEICERFNVAQHPQVVILNHPTDNAFAVKFANKKMIVLLSDILEPIIDQPAELRFIIGHEMGHVLLDFGGSSWFFLYKTAAYKAARELTCDNVGMVCARSTKASVNVLKQLAVGHQLRDRISLKSAIMESRQIYSGLTGWFIKQYLTYPPVGRRIENLKEFSESLAATSREPGLETAPQMA
jgi:Zn-dependent protease with chaperone function